MPMKGDYPKLTPEIKMRLETEILGLIENNSRVVEDKELYGSEDSQEFVSFEGAPKEFLNYFIDFTQEAYQEKGIEMPDLQGITLSLGSTDEVHEICGEGAIGCHGSNHITISDEFPFEEFFRIFAHEFGHQIYSGNMEYPSEANESYSAIKLYEFSKRIGSLMVSNSFVWGSRSPFEDQTPFNRRYSKGRLFGIVNLNDNLGDVEEAMDYVAHTRLLAIEARLEDKVSEYKTDDPLDMCFEEWDKLLDSFYFLSNLRDGGLTFPEDSEFAGYMKLLNYNNFKDGFSGNNLVEGYYGLLRQIEISSYSVNPYFKGKVVDWLTEKNYGAIDALTVEGDLVSDEIYGLARSIIDTNKDYPCTVKDPYECPVAIRGIRSPHVFAYYVSNYAAYNGDDDSRKLESLDDAVDFIERFYPDASFFTGDFTALESSIQTQTNNYVPPIATNAGIYALGYNPDLAFRLFSAAVAVDCLGHPRVYAVDKSCWEMKELAQSYLDKINAR
ncbi:MAG: hypothetical protein V1914_00135 [archaeon]